MCWIDHGAYLEELVLLDALEQVVLPALLLDDSAGFVGLHLVSFRSGRGKRVAYKDADLLVCVLAGHSVGGELHQDRLGSHC